MYRFFAILVKFIPKYFMLCDAIVNGTVFVIPFLYCLLLVCRNATGFCMLIFYSTTLPNSFISSNTTHVEYLGFLINKINVICEQR